ncbi:MAG: clostripain-related cysteine peptidase [bacterium]
MKRLCFSLFFLLTTSVFATADWTLYVHMAADNNLSTYASMDLVDEMAKATLSERINVVAQCDLPNHLGTYRYKIENNEVVTLEVLASEMGQNPEQDLVSGMRWAAQNFPANHYAISLWGHGSGIIDPIRKITRGILYDDTNDTYLNNQDMLSALIQIKNEVLGGKKIDVLGMDACLMADLEVGYQIKDCVNYFVASQQTEPAFGWDYCGFLTSASTAYLTPAQFATAIVNSYKVFYDEKQTADYTQSVVDLTKIDLVEQKLNLIVDKWNQCEEVLGIEFKNVIDQVRNKSLEFEDDDFIDLHFFCKTVLDELETIELPEPEPEQEPEPQPEPEVVEQEESEIEQQPSSPRPSLIFQRPNFLFNFSNRPNFGPTPNVFIRPSNLPPPGLEARPSSVPRPLRPQNNISPIPQVIVRPSNTPGSIQPRPGFSLQLNNNRPLRPVISARSFDLFKDLNFVELDLTNLAIENLTNNLQVLKDLLSEEMLLIEQAVIANATGSQMKNAKGISIYFPKYDIHSSYYLTNFAIDGKWVSFLSKFV